MGGGGPAKTMFGYAAPVQRPMPSQPQPPTTGMQPPRPPMPQPGMPQQPGYPPPQQPGYPPAATPPQQGYGAPPQQPGYPQQPGFPPQQPGYPQQPPMPQMQQPQGYPQQPQMPAPMQQPGFPPQPPMQQPGYPPPQPMAQPGYPQQPQMPAPMQQPMAQPGYPQPGMPQPGYPQQPGMPQQAPAGGGYGALPHGIPASAPGTLFGFPLSKMREASVQRTMLFLAGVALLGSIFVPFFLSPLVFGFTSPMPAWDFLLWPAVSGGIYLFIAAAPPHLRAKVPPVALHWAPFVVAYYGVLQSYLGFGFMAFGVAMAAAAKGGGADAAMFVFIPSSLYCIGYATLVFGLLTRLSSPQDAIAPFLVVAGVGMIFPYWLDQLSYAFHFGGGAIIISLTLFIWFLVNTAAVGSIFCVINGVRFGTTTVKLPPALAGLDKFTPVVTAALIVWLPALHVLLALGMLIHAHGGINAILIMAHGLLPVFAFFGVLMVTAPAAYEEAKKMFTKSGGGAQPPQAPPGGGYPPAGGGYPPQGGGYPPQGGGYPPQGGGYPPQGGGYPPQGGGWPQQ
jgi:hypothetical protein